VLANFLTGRITPRGRDIVALNLEGYPVIAIADRLGLSDNTIKSHRNRLYAKLDITTEREQFVMYVYHLTRRRPGAATILAAIGALMWHATDRRPHATVDGALSNFINGINMLETRSGPCPTARCRHSIQGLHLSGPDVAT
jgi:DNA-binding CsgD family transcriptional regulator